MTANERLRFDTVDVQADQPTFAQDVATRACRATKVAATKVFLRRTRLATLRADLRASRVLSVPGGTRYFYDICGGDSRGGRLATPGGIWLRQRHQDPPSPGRLRTGRAPVHLLSGGHLTDDPAG